MCYGDTVHLTIPNHEHFEIFPPTSIQFNADSTLLIFSPTTTTTYTMNGSGVGECKGYDTTEFTIYVAPPFYGLLPFTDTALSEGESILYENIPKNENVSISPITGAQFNSG